MLRHSGVLAVLLCTASARGVVEGPGRTQFIRAERAEGPIRVDGRLDKPGWQRARVFSEFVQRFPTSGAAPGERTELRVLDSEDAVYVGVIARDSQPALIDRRVARRDSDAFSDSII